MPLIKQGQVVDDGFVTALEEADLPAEGPVIVSLEVWQSRREDLLARGEKLGVRLHSDQQPDQVADDLEHFSVVALEFPVFTDGRAYSYARLLRERFGYRGELRAVGEVLLEQLHYMDRVGFDAFEVQSEHALEDWLAASKDLDVWYQPASDDRKTVWEQRREH
jgi:uncharacterized protein (DUF934 family)